MSAIVPLRLSGSVPALVTPFAGHSASLLNHIALARLAVRAIDRGSSGVVVSGSTGEAPALRAEEHAEAVRIAVQALRGRAPVIAGVGAPSTEVAVGLSIAAEQNGAAALLVSAPPYVRPPQEGLYAHVRAISDATHLPIVLYDVPSRAAVAFSDSTIARLRTDGIIHALKDATADLARPERLRKLCGDDFIQLSGDDATALAYRTAGGHGCISVMANVVPSLSAKMHTLWDAGDVEQAFTLAERLAPLSDLLFVESNPIPVKAALNLLGLCDSTLRLPLIRATDGTIRQLAEVLPELHALDEATSLKISRVA